jgi:hypothetical protein
MTKFVIFTLPRTGSTLLSKSLNTHPEIFCDDEIFHFSFRDYFSPHQFRFWKIRFLPKKINYVINYPRTFLKMKRFLDNFYRNRADEKFRARGFKLMYYQTFYTPGLLSYLKNNDVKVILLVRENVLRNALSDLRARSTGIYHYQETENVSNDIPKLNVDMNLLQNKMLDIVNQNNKLEELTRGIDHVKIRYEDFSDWDETMQRITRFLKVSRRQIEEGAKRLNPIHLEDMIENYGEVREWLKNSDYSNFVN